MQRHLTTGALLAVAAAALGPSCASRPASETARTQALLGVTDPNAPRLILGPLLASIRARASASDPTWKAMQVSCDAWARPETVFNVATGNAYPSAPNVGQGYQGDGYTDALLSLALCYQATGNVTYGQTGSRLLDVVATPEGAGGGRPSGDSGYGIRNFGFALAVGYDWLRPVLSAASKARAQAALSAWIGWFDANGFTRNDPVSNYFAGYLVAKTAAGLALGPAVGSSATTDVELKADTWWNDVDTRLWGQLAGPQYKTKLVGGGWPEGWGYGPRAVQAIVLAQWMARTAKGRTWDEDVPLASWEATHLMHFAWSSMTRMDDQGTVRSGNPLKPSAALASTLAAALESHARPEAAAASSFMTEIAGKADDRGAWQRFLFAPASGGSIPNWRTGRALSLTAEGPGWTTSRSSWAADAVMSVFSAGAYTGAVDMGEQLYNQGELAITRGEAPLLVRPTGWLPQASGKAGADLVYQDSYSSGPPRRMLYNTFFAASPSNPYSPGQAPAPAAATRLEKVEEVPGAPGAPGYHRARGAQIEQAYRGGVAAFARDVVHLRPDVFVVRDATTVTDPAADRWLAFHLPGAPVQVAGLDATQRRYVVPGIAVAALLPKSAAANVVPVLPPSAGQAGDVYRVEFRPAARDHAADVWLTVLLTAATPPAVERIEGAAVVGASVQSVPRNQVAAFASLPSGATLSYSVAATADADHVLFDLPASPAGYAAAAAPSGGRLTVTVKPGGPLRTSAEGTLAFSVTRAGVVGAPSWGGVLPPAPPAADAGAPQAGCDAGLPATQQCLLPCVQKCASSCNVQP